MSSEKNEIHVKGRKIEIESNVIDGKTIVVLGKALRQATIKDEICDDGVRDPEHLVRELKRAGNADILTFDQKLPDTQPKFDFYFEWDNVAALEVTTYDDWWTKKIQNDARRMVRKAAKKGVVVKVVDFDDELVRGIKRVYDESPLRQGKRFWHYRKDIERVKEENGSFPERSEFIGAYLDDELIGFNKIIYTGERADQIQLVSMIRHRDKAPTNALIAKAVEVCAERGARHLTYGKFLYGRKAVDSLCDFKRRNGFDKVDVPRYYIPLTLRGEVALKLGLHRGILELLPSPVINAALKLRARLYSFRYRNTR